MPVYDRDGAGGIGVWMSPWGAFQGCRRTLGRIGICEPAAPLQGAMVTQKKLESKRQSRKVGHQNNAKLTVSVRLLACRI